MEIGRKLKEAREKKGITIKTLQERTKIRKKYLLAIEEDNYEPIPGQIYVKVFIKAYAKEVGLDQDQLAQEYSDWLAEKKKAEEAKKKEQNKAEEAEKGFFNSLFTNQFFNSNLFKVIIIILLIAIVGFLFYNIFWSTKTQNTRQNIDKIVKEEGEIGGTDRLSDPQKDLSDQKKLQSQEQILQNSQETEGKEEIQPKKVIKVKETREEAKDRDETDAKLETDKIADNSSNPIDKSEERSFKIIADQRSWLRIGIDGQNVFQGFIDKGEVIEDKGQAKVNLKIGNGVAIRVQINNRTLGPWGKADEVVEEEISLK